MDLADKIEFVVYDHDYMSADDLCGFGRILTEEFLDEKQHERWLELNPQGKLLLRFKYEKSQVSDEQHEEGKERRQTLMELESSCPFRRVTEDYRLMKTVGKGGFSVVVQGLKKSSGRQVAIKVINKTKAGQRCLFLTLKEIRMQRQCAHPNIVRVEEYFQDHDNFYIVMELLRGGELFYEIVKRKFYSEKDASGIIQQLLDAVEYMHHKKVVHRDIKPENLLLEDADADSVLKVADFGLAFEVDDPPPVGSISGTPAYMAPEMIRKMPYSTEIDEWACGVVLYILLCGYPPFWSESRKELFANIETGRYEFDSPAWDDVTDEAKDLVSKLLDVNPNARLSAKEALKHPWIMCEEIPATIQRSSTLSKLEEFNAQRKFKGAVSAILQVRRMTKKLGALKSSMKSAATVHDVPMTDSPPVMKKMAERKEVAKKSLEQKIATERGVHFEPVAFSLFLCVSGLMFALFALPVYSMLKTCDVLSFSWSSVRCVLIDSVEDLFRNELTIAIALSWVSLFTSITCIVFMEPGRRAFIPNTVMIYAFLSANLVGIAPSFILFTSMYDLSPSNCVGMIGYVKSYNRKLVLFNFSAFIILITIIPVLEGMLGALTCLLFLYVLIVPLVFLWTLWYGNKGMDGKGFEHVVKTDRPFVYFFYGLLSVANGPFIWRSYLSGASWENLEYLSLFFTSFSEFRQENTLSAYILTDILFFAVFFLFVVWRNHNLKVALLFFVLSLCTTPGFALPVYLIYREYLITC